MTGIEHGLVGYPGQPGVDRLVQRLGITAGQIRPPTPVEEEGVAGDQSTADQKALAPGSVPRRVDQGDGHRSDVDLSLIHI